MKTTSTSFACGLLAALWAAAGFGAQDLSAQNTNSDRMRCGHTHAMQQLAERQPQAVATMRALQEENLERVRMRSDNAAGQRGVGGPDPDSVIYIPTVVHVVYNNAAQNLSTAQIRSQIDVLNEDFARLNSDFGDARPEFRSIGGVGNIQFCLAEWDPEGNPTDGIVRVETTETSFDQTDSPNGWDNVKRSLNGGSDAWPRNQYLNIWVCNLDPGAGVLGYAYPPGGTAVLDGVVISYRFFGDQGATPPYNLGRTTTHEIGHWLGLRHIWGDGPCSVDDGIDDTPSANGPNFGCPSIASAVSCGTEDMFENFMDYTDDRCMVMFTEDQVELMRDVLIRNGRTQILNSDKCYFNTAIADPGAGDQDGIRLWPNPATGPTVQWGLEQAAAAEGTLLLYDAMGRVVRSENLPSGFQTGTLSLDGLSSGMYTMVLESGAVLRQHRLLVSGR
jgi:hypothetical protein